MEAVFACGLDPEGGGDRPGRDRPRPGRQGPHQPHRLLGAADVSSPVSTGGCTATMAIGSDASAIWRGSWPSSPAPAAASGGRSRWRWPRPEARRCWSGGRENRCGRPPRWWPASAGQSLVRARRRDRRSGGGSRSSPRPRTSWRGSTPRSSRPVSVATGRSSRTRSPIGKRPSPPT